MTVTIDRADVARIEEHALQSLPEECCGFLLGVTGEAKRVREVVRAKNVALSMRERRYTVDPLEFSRLEASLSGSDREITGFYHSHPNAPARPSEYDLANAWPVYSYVIISIVDQRMRDVASWTLRQDTGLFEKEELVILEQAGL